MDDVVVRMLARVMCDDISISHDMVPAEANDFSFLPCTLLVTHA